MSYVYICLPDLQRGRTRWALIASQVPVTPTNEVHMFRIVDSGTIRDNTVNFLLEEDTVTLSLLSDGDYVGAIYVGHTTDVVHTHQEFIEYIRSSASINPLGICESQILVAHTSVSHQFLAADWDNSQWLSDLVGSMTLNEAGIVDASMPFEGVADNHTKFLRYLEEERIPDLMRQPLGFGNIVPLVPGVVVPR